MAGAEDGGGGGEFRRGDSGGGGRGEVVGMGDEGGEDVENSRDAPRDGAGWCRGGWGCSGHGLVVAGLGEQSKNFVVGFPMNGCVEWDVGARREARVRAGRRAVSVEPGRALAA